MLSRNISRIGILAIISAFVLGSASARKNDPNAVGGRGGAGGPAMATPPAPQAMPPEYAYGFWESSFGAVRIDRDTRVAMPEAVTGTWTYNRGGEYVTGYFAGTLRGTVLEFSWTEPLQPPLTGTGFIAFDSAGTSFSGSWATSNRDRSGTWTGWRGQQQAAPAPVAPPPAPNDPAAAPLPPPVEPAAPVAPVAPAQPASPYPPQPQAPTYYPAPAAPAPAQPQPPTYYPYPAPPAPAQPQPPSGAPGAPNT
ncbi:MAG: hypothetical protein IPL79_07170 [Myxococcales bacterium]|nr:hypothetical protein [Myxococcales bacterium]